MGVHVASGVARRADVRLESGRVLVSAVNGPVKVWNSAGVPVASMTPGRTLSFQPMASGSATSLMRGTVTREGDPFLPSGLRVELRGTAGLVIGIIVVAAFTAGISTYFAATNDPPVSR